MPDRGSQDIGTLNKPAISWMTLSSDLALHQAHHFWHFIDQSDAKMQPAFRSNRDLRTRTRLAWPIASPPPTLYQRGSRSSCRSSLKVRLRPAHRGSRRSPVLLLAGV